MEGDRAGRSLGDQGGGGGGVWEQEERGWKTGFPSWWEPGKIEKHFETLYNILHKIGRIALSSTGAPPVEKRQDNGGWEGGKMKN